MFFYYESKASHLKNIFNESNISLVIAPTISCNFHCPYCFELKDDKSTMSEEVESGIVEFIRKHKKAESLSLTWYGGEPLLAFGKIESLWNRINKGLPNLDIRGHSLITNGWLINDEIIKFFKNTKLKYAQITLDGRKENHDLFRHLHNGASTFDKIIENAIKFAKEIPQLQLSVRVNITRYNQLDYREIKSFFDTAGLKNISVYPGFVRIETPDGRHSNTILSLRKTTTISI